MTQELPEHDVQFLPQPAQIVAGMSDVYSHEHVVKQKASFLSVLKLIVHGLGADE